MKKFLRLFLMFLMSITLMACNADSTSQTTKSQTSNSDKESSSSSSSSKSDYGSSSSSKSTYDSSDTGSKEYDMPNESDETFSDYVKRVDPELYSDMEDIYNDAADDYDSDDDYSSNYGAGGYEMPNESDESFSDYVKRVDPELYSDMEDIYNGLE